jgi:hypothetical protein
VAAFALGLFFFVNSRWSSETGSGSGPPTAHFDTAEVAAQVPLESGHKSTATLDFSDGSSVVFQEKASGTIEELSPEHTGLRLRQGRVEVSVKKKAGRTWTLRAGPYSVRVVGTRFSVDFDQERQRVFVAVTEGQVLVLGGGLPEAGVAVGAGGRLERQEGADHARAAKLEAKQEPPRRENESLEEEATQQNLKPIPPSKAPVSWRERAREGSYQAALEAAKREGFQRLVQTLNDADLLLLANAARYAGDGGHARTALLGLRERFPGSAAASLAAFYRARQSGPATPAGVQWLRTYLREAPSGELAAAARVDLMNALLGMGDKQGARQIAAEYLRYHPSGPHAAKARDLSKRATP